MLVLSRINIIVSSFCMLVFMLFGTHDHYQCFSEVSGTTSVGYYVICCWVNLLAISVVILLCSVCGESLPVSLLSTALWFTSIIRIVPVQSAFISLGQPLCCLKLSFFRVVCRANFHFLTFHHQHRCPLSRVQFMLD